MTTDGFQLAHMAPFVSFSPQSADRFFGALAWVGRRLHVEVEGIANLPPGRALLVANHTFGWDAAFPMGAIWRATRRPVWALGEHAWWAVPVLRRMAASIGTVDGTPENADRLLSADALLVVLPGGLREAVKPRELRYRLLWGKRFGFVRTAIRNRAPLVPLACIGSDDLFDFVGDAYERGERWLHRPGIPVPLPSRILPIPHRAHLRFIIGKPISTGAEPEEANDPNVLSRVRHEVEGALHELIERELAHRAGIACD